MERKRDAGRKGKSAGGVRGKNQGAKGRAPASPPRNLNFLHLKVLVSGEIRYSDDLGNWDIRDAVIRFDKDADANVVRETILHESLHVVFEHTGIDASLHEPVIASISPLLLHMLRANPSLVRYLTSA